MDGSDLKDVVYDKMVVATKSISNLNDSILRRWFEYIMFKFKALEEEVKELKEKNEELKTELVMMELRMGD